MNRHLPVVFVLGFIPLFAASCSVKQHPDGLHVSCSHSHLTSLPVTWVGDVVWLDVSHNQLAELPDLSHPSLSRLRHLDLSHNVIKVLDQHALRRLSQLRRLDVSHNQLRVIGGDTFREGPPSLETLLLDHNGLVQVEDDAFLGLSGLRWLRLDNNGLSSLSAGTFRGPGHLTALDVSHNALDKLRNGTFSALVRLQSLQLNHNRLEKLEMSAFIGLSSLTEVSLDSNPLQLQHSSLPAGVFAPLRSVEKFALSQNSEVEVTDFPRGVFNDFVSVKYLVLDFFHDLEFGPDFASLSHILTVDLSNDCRAKKISNDTLFGFQNSSLQRLSFRHCCLNHIETCAFCNLPHLKYLDLSHNVYLRPSVALLSLYGLQGQSMDEINMVRTGRSLPVYFSVDRNNARYLRNICVKRFSVARSHLVRLASNALSDTPNIEFARCIQDLDFSQNQLAGDSASILRILMNFRNLTSVKLQEQRVYSLREASCVLSVDLNCAHRSPRPPQLITFDILMPARLTYLNMSSVFRYFNSPTQRIRFTNARGLKILDISFGTLASCLTTFFGLDSLETFVLSGNFCNNISDTIFDYLPSLRRLYLSNSHLDSEVMATRAHRLLQKLVGLETLDLSRNRLTQLEGHSLPAQTRLRELILSHNSFKTVPVDIDLHPDLTVLDLSFNTLTSLTSSERHTLDNHGTRHQFRLKLRGNPLACACSSLSFLRWLWSTPVILDGEGSSTRRYRCTSDTGELTNTERVMADWKFLWRRCIGQQVFGLALSGFLLQMLGLVTAYLITRSWTHLRYAWHVLRHLRLPRRHDFERDAYVVYADDDVELACRKLPQCLEPFGVRLLLSEKEDMPGTPRTANIVRNIEKSWKVLLLVTPAFAACELTCGFTVQQAQYSITDTSPDRVVVVFLEDPRHLPPMASLELLLRNYPEGNVFHVHKDTPPNHPVWARLVKAILGEEDN